MWCCDVFFRFQSACSEGWQSQFHKIIRLQLLLPAGMLLLQVEGVLRGKILDLLSTPMTFTLLYWTVGNTSIFSKILLKSLNVVSLKDISKIRINTIFVLVLMKVHCNSHLGILIWHTNVTITTGFKGRVM